MNVPKLTLDTNLLFEYWKQRKKMDIVESLLDLAKLRKVDLAVTRRIRQDIPKPELSNKLDELPELLIEETGSVARYGFWLLDGREMIADNKFNNFLPIAVKLAKKRGKTPPDWRDLDHLQAHYLLHRDIFLTWDEGIICLHKELKDEFNLDVKRPDEYLNYFNRLED